jgi:ATP/maltotriose-dependent transcriptional regulator MalT/DNA-binding SARP family transcriptional activator
VKTGARAQDDAPTADEAVGSAGRTPKVKLVPPRVPASYVPRPALEGTLDGAIDHRLTAVIAGAGFGKSTHVACRALDNGWAWYTIDRGDASLRAIGNGLAAALKRRLPGLREPVVPGGAGRDDRAAAETLASALAQALEDELSGDLVLVVDDVHELGRESPGVRLLEGLTRFAPPEFHLVICSREEPPFSVARLRGRGEVLDVGGSDLAFRIDEVAARLVGAGVREAAELAEPLHDVTGGWPAAVELAAEMLASMDTTRRHDAVRALARRRGPLYSYLAEEVFGRESPRVRRLLRSAAQLDRFTPDLCETLGIAGADELLDDLVRRGLVADPPEGSGGWYALHALVRQFVRETWPLDAGELLEVRRRAAVWFEAAGHIEEALAALTAAQDADGILKLFSRRWLELLDSGSLDAVVKAGAVLPIDLRKHFAYLVAHCHILRGDFDQAYAWLALREKETLDPDFAFHLALIHINRGEPREALDVLVRSEGGLEDWGLSPAMHYAFAAFQLLSLGRLAEARGYAERAFEAARKEPGTTLVAEAHAALGALARAEGDLAGADSHFQSALEIAERIGNVLATCSMRTWIAYLRTEQGRYAEALEEAGRAIELADRIGWSLFQAWAPSARGRIQLDLGRLDEAQDEFSVAHAVYERLGSSAVAETLIGLGDVCRERGELVQARSLYERALAGADRSGVVQFRVSAQAGLARVLVDEDPDEASRLAGAAALVEWGACRGPALVAAGWVALRRDDRRRAESAAASALAEARRRGTPAVLAESLELQSFCADEPTHARRSLEEAVGIWRRLGNALGLARAELALALLQGAADSPEAQRAQSVLRRIGVRGANAGGAGTLLMLETEQNVPLRVATLGRFDVVRDGHPVPSGEWQSKKARDLLKILVARRGQATTREYLMETLWPDEDPSKTSNRLSVALSVVRTVLDPEHGSPADHYVVADTSSVRLDLEHVAVDVEEFLYRADQGLKLHREGSADAAPLLEAAETAYSGDFLEEDRYEDWASSLREEVRAAYVEVARALAGARVGDESAVRYYLRILRIDPYDEAAHLDLVSAFASAGMHGEARRAYRRYVGRMDEIGVEPAPLARPDSRTGRQTP